MPTKKKKAAKKKPFRPANKNTRALLNEQERRRQGKTPKKLGR